MSVVPPPPPDPAYPPFSADPPPRRTADSHAARLTIPYLGDDPPRSRTVGIALQVALLLAAGLWGLRIVLYLWQASIEQDFLDHRTRELAARVVDGTHRLSFVNGIAKLAIVAIIGLEVAWRTTRRPKQTRENLGEAYVEFPLSWVTPVWLRVAGAALALAALLAGLAGSTNHTTLPADYPVHRQWSALANLLWACLWLLLVVWVHLANTAQQRRMAWSQPYRLDPAQVPYFPTVGREPVAGRGPRSSAGGLGWLVRTSGLILLALIGFGALIGGVTESGHGHAGGLAWAIAGAAMIGVVGWAMVRRYQQGKL